MSDIASAPLALAAIQTRRQKEGNMSRIRHIAVVTSNQEKLGNFYKTAFGMKEVKGIGSALYLSDGYMNLALIKKTPELKVDEGLYHFGFEVDDVEPLKDIFK